MKNPEVKTEIEIAQPKPKSGKFITDLLAYNLVPIIFFILCVVNLCINTLYEIPVQFII